ncbi:MAG: peptide chain release factor N(5)-glutamine methyltransferase [Candidatus Dadabacteria bacterium]|nr:MAG: peptide chain release factor N(5)-glutamine methyltransferase [Candidatus Dadabacteria bacterium]
MTVAVRADRWTVRDVRGWMIERFERAGIENPRLDADLLISDVLACNRAGVIARLEQPLDAAERERLREHVRRRLNREPVAYILGLRGFGDVELRVGPGVLVPRPETEFVCDAAIEWLRGSDAPMGPVIDCGTGSGAIAISIARRVADRRVYAVERAAAAVAWARTNIEQWATSVELVEADWHDALQRCGPFALVVSNPPYVPDADVPGQGIASPELKWEPADALYAGPDGLDAIRTLVPAAHDALLPGGRLIFEIGAGQQAAVASLLGQSGFDNIEWFNDYGGIVRVASARRPDK